MTKRVILVAALMGSLLFTLPADARKPRSGNYVNAEGCLVVWEAKYFLGVRVSYTETKFCNSDGSPVNFGLQEEVFSDTFSL